MVLAISAAEPVNVRGGGCVESVVTPRTHLRFCVRAFVEVEGIDLAPFYPAVQADGRNVLADPDLVASTTPGRCDWRRGTLLRLMDGAGTHRDQWKIRGPCHSQIVRRDGGEAECQHQDRR
jgi:hypothetical protein